MLMLLRFYDVLRRPRLAPPSHRDPEDPLTHFTRSTAIGVLSQFPGKARGQDFAQCQHPCRLWLTGRIILRMKAVGKDEAQHEKMKGAHLNWEARCCR